MDKAEAVRQVALEISELREKRAKLAKRVASLELSVSLVSTQTAKIGIRRALKPIADEMEEVDARIEGLQCGQQELPKLCSSCAGSGNEKGLNEPCSRCQGKGLETAHTVETLATVHTILQ